MILSIRTEYDLDGMPVILTEYPAAGTFELSAIPGIDSPFASRWEIGITGTLPAVHTAYRIPNSIQPPTIPTLEGTE